jgi:hypothetical protein
VSGQANRTLKVPEKKLLFCISLSNLPTTLVKTLSSSIPTQAKYNQQHTIAKTLLQPDILKTEQKNRKAPAKAGAFSITRNPLIHNILRVNHLDRIFYSRSSAVSGTKQAR